jgi:hypothetical protein
MATVKGDVRLGAHTLRMDFNALCDAEEDFPGIMQGQVDLTTFSAIRKIVGHALAAHHPDLTLREVGDIIHEAGLDRAAEAVTEAMTASFPTPEGGETANPRKAPAKAGAGTKR